MTAVSAIVFFLGLLFGFQRPSRLLVAAATSCYRPASLHPFQPRGAHSLFRIGFSVKRPLPLRFTDSPRHCFVEGARNLLRFRLPCQPASSTLLFRPSDFRLSGEAASTTAALGVNSVPPTPYSAFQPVRKSPPPARLHFPVRGRAAPTTAASRVNTLLRLHLPASSTLTEQLGARSTCGFPSNLEPWCFHSAVASQRPSVRPTPPC